MNRNSESAVKQYAALDALSAELAATAYRVALRTRAEGTWLDLELNLWKALSHTVQASRGNRLARGGP